MEHFSGYIQQWLHFRTHHALQLASQRGKKSMERSKLIELFRALATEIAEKDFSGLSEDSTIASMGVDSLAMLEVVGDMERELEIRIPAEDLNGVETVRQLLDLVEQRITTDS